MLEGLAAWVLNNYIGEYVENLNTDQLSIGLFQGEVELDNLPLKKDALKHLDLPLEVKSGFIGRIHLAIPVKRLKSEPWVITLEKLYLVAGPLSARGYDATQDKKAEQARKEAQLKALEERWRVQKQIGIEPQNAGSYYSWWSYGTSLASNILENLQLKVRDVHIRYEDDQTIPGCPFACGVTIKSLSAQSTDGTWVPKFVSSSSVDMMHKLVDLQEFSAYWDVATTLIGHLPQNQLGEALQKCVSKCETPDMAHDPGYVLAPVTAQARMKRNTSVLPLRSPGQSRISFDVDLDTLGFNLSEDQYRGLIVWLKEFSRHDKARKFCRWRPTVSVKNNARLWWDFSIQSHLHFIRERNHRRTRRYLVQRVHDNLVYVDAYVECITSGPQYMDSDHKEHMELVEAEWNFEELKILREVAMLRIERDKRQLSPGSASLPHTEDTLLGSSEPSPADSISLTVSHAASPVSDQADKTALVHAGLTQEQSEIPGASQQHGETMLQRWFPGWGGWYGYGSSGAPPLGDMSPDEEAVPIAPSPMTTTEEQQHLEQEILDVLADSAENNTLLKRDTVFAKLNFTLKSGTFQLLRSSDSAASSPVSTSNIKTLQPLLELECAEIAMGFESRPRTNGLQFSISMGALYLRDRLTVGSLRPVLIQPQQRDTQLGGRPLFSGMLGVVGARTTSYLQPLLTTTASQEKTDEGPLFQMIYEKKPPGTKADYRLEMKTRPLDIVYNPTAIKRVKEFFTVKRRGVSAIATELEIAAAARSKYEALKRQTQDELRQTIDQLLEEDDKIKAKRWDIDMEICAPQITVPESFTDENTMQVVFDLGRLQFHNDSAGLKEEVPTEDDDEDFVTPSSTPPNNEEQAAPPSELNKDTLSDLFSGDLSEAALHDKIYDKYTVSLSEVQVMVGRAKDKWAHAHTKGTSHMHVVDKFSISLQMDRRLLYTSDPQWPKVSVSGTLPSLTLHINEPKVQALSKCASYFSNGESEMSIPSGGRKPAPKLSAVAQAESIDKSMYYSVYQAYSKSVASLPEAMHDDQQTKQAIAESKLLLMQFSINHMSLEIQSKVLGRHIAELQVGGVRANITRRPYDTSLSFSVHSLLIVDALQTFGPDFELLVASHKSLCLDSQSGSLRDSDPNSPISPQSPKSPGSPAEPVRLIPGQSHHRSTLHKVQAALSGALNPSGSPSPVAMPMASPGSTPPLAISPFSSFNAPRETSTGTSTGAGLYLPFLPAVDAEALIKVELDIVSPSCPTSGSGDDTLHIANIQFNNLDLIANQQTIVELLGFFRRITPHTQPSPASPQLGDQTTPSELASSTATQGGTVRWEVTADFHRLNVLLMRVEEKDHEMLARKVATASLSDAKIQATLAGDLQVEGYLGGLQLLNLTPEDSRHQKVFSVGLDSSSSRHHYNILGADMLAQLQQGDMYKTAHESILAETSSDRAFTFTLFRPGKLGKMPLGTPSHVRYAATRFNDSDDDSETGSVCGENEFMVTIRMASMFYTHCPAFLKELSVCVAEFQEYMSALGSSLRSAAQEVALGLVTRRSGALGASMYGSNLSLDQGGRQRHASTSEGPDLTAFGQSGDDAVDDLEPGPSLTLKLDAVLQTPVILLPRHRTSSEVLMACLGRISIVKADHPPPASAEGNSQEKQLQSEENKIFVNISDMSIYSVDLDKQKPIKQVDQPDKQFGGTAGLFMSSFGTTHHVGMDYGTPILHKTCMDFTLSQKEPDENYVNQDTVDISLSEELMNTSFKRTNSATESPRTTVDVRGKVTTPLSLVLSKFVFEQILQTLDNITPEDDVNQHSAKYESKSKPNLSDITEDNESSLEQSMSALKMDGVPPLSRLSSHDAVEAESSAADPVKDSGGMVLQAVFEMPIFSVQMTGDLGEGEQGIVDLKLKDFRVSLEKRDPWVKQLEMSLQSLVMEDLLQDAVSSHRYLMVSSAPSPHTPPSRGQQSLNRYISQSCPTSMIDVPLPDLPPSLPSSFHEENVFFSSTKPKQSDSSNARPARHTHLNAPQACPHTPPPSPLHSHSRSQKDDTSDDLLVHLKLKLVDRKHPEFATTFNSTNRYVDVKFNGLDTTINLQTWVVVLDFLGMGAKVHDIDQFTQEAFMSRSASRSLDLSSTLMGEDDKEPTNTEVELRVESMTLTLNKPEYELACANISRFDSHVSLRDGNFHIKGQLGSMSLQDRSPHGKMYRERFVTTGTQAFIFDIFKHGTPDPDLLRDCDMRVDLHMSSVWYVHTHRFLQEVLTFLQHFNHLQDMLGHMRAASTGKKIPEKAYRGARIRMNIEAGAPIMLIPHSSRSTDILVMDMGTMSVHNTFLLTGSPGTIAHSKQEGKPSSTESSETLQPETAVSNDSGMTMSASMTQSVYGSLDDDWRTDVMEASSGSPLGSSGSRSPRPDHTHTSASLSSFCSSLGGATGLTHRSTGVGVSQSGPVHVEESACNFESAGSDPPQASAAHVCVLDVMHVELEEMDLFSAEWRPKDTKLSHHREMVFPSFVVQRREGKLLQETCRLTLQVERNLEGDISHSVPDFSVEGKLTSLHFLVDLRQYQLIRGLLAHNFGEPLDDFQKPMNNMTDPSLMTVLSGDVWKAISIGLDLDGVSTEILDGRQDSQQNLADRSLGRFDFITSRLMFESYSNGCKDINLVSHEIKVYDTRYRDEPVNVRPNVFTEILKPTHSLGTDKTLQMELHFRMTNEFTRFTVLLNNMRVMGVFDWLLAVSKFLITGPEDPFKKDKEENSTSKPGYSRQASGAAALAGIVTKRTTVVEKQEPPFELKLNVTDTELVVVEDTRDRDTNAVILKSTAVLSYRARHAERPLSCSLQSVEVFSCSLSAEDDTALSIIDPMTILMELNSGPHTKQRATGSSGLLDVAINVDNPPILEISFSSLNVRLSYNDLQLFLAIFRSMPNQLLQASNGGASEVQPPRNAPPSKYPAWQMKKLEELNFAAEDCEQALAATNGSVQDAAFWLTENVAPLPPKVKKDKQGGLLLSGFEVKASCICLCLIDDCLDADVPLAELTFSDIQCLHTVQSQNQQGYVHFKFAADYYNCALSGWEPFLEYWECQVKWTQSEDNKTHVKVTAHEPLNLNITPVLMERINITKSKWTEDYERSNRMAEPGYNNRKRVPFIPFAIRNHTGCKLSFTTVTTTPTRAQPSPAGSPQDSGVTTPWRQVMPDDELPFLMEEHEKMRHKHTHELRVHQLVVRVEGWQAMAPVSMDKTGTYFRSAKPDFEKTAGMYYSVPPPARVVFDVNIEGSARKVITVRSALLVDNRLQDDLEVKLEANSPLESTTRVSERRHPLRVLSGTRQAVPLMQVHSRMLLKPLGWSLNWCQEPVEWQTVTQPGQQHKQLCTAGIVACDGHYRFCVSVYREQYPVSIPEGKYSPSQMQGVLEHPGHIITILPPIRLENLLPIDLTYYLKDSSTKGVIKPGKTAAPTAIDVTKDFELGVQLENFSQCKELWVPSGTADYRVRLCLYDTSNRLLELGVLIKRGLGDALKVSVYAPYWLVNKSGLPLIFKQDSASQAAGQFEEHELARSVTPLLFSYAEKEKPYMCTMRLGKSVHGPKTTSQWCSRMSLESGVGMRSLHVTPYESRPDWVYNIGIEVRQGRGRYCDTNIITFSPRYVLDNRSSHKLAFAQRHIAQSWSASSEDYLSALPSSTISFHWPRVDLDLLLCVRRMDMKNCRWSGGFQIQEINSFHINMRGDSNECLFLRTDIVPYGSTLYVVFSDADHMPPPYRIDNFSEIPVEYTQTDVQDTQLKTSIRPTTSVPYAWDEPTLDPSITLKVQGGLKETYNLDKVGDGKQLCYENFIFVAFSGTFKTSSMDSSKYSNFVESQELVLDVAEPNHKVILKKRESGRRSQLWRMTSLGMLEHEGSAVPRYPHKTSASSRMVLDIATLALQPNTEMALCLRKKDERRTSTQMWRFTEDGRLCCGSQTNLCVQAKDGIFGLQEYGTVVLGPSAPHVPHGRIDMPIYMAVTRQKMRPGSGLLTVKVITDGPTRVLQITDIQHQRLMSHSGSSSSDGWVVVSEQKKRAPLQTEQLPDQGEMEVTITLPAGVGVSLVNHVLEELVYISLQDILLNYTACATGTCVELGVRNIQIDNQLFGTYTPVVLYVTPVPKREAEQQSKPALQVSIHKIPSHQWNADIFKHVIISIKKMTIGVEECLMWKLLQFFGCGQIDSEIEKVDENSFDSQKALTAATSSHLKRYYFGTLKVVTACITLSMMSVSHSDLPQDLLAIKRTMGLHLVRFEDAKVELDPFERHHPFETLAFLLEQMQHHFVEELKSQAAKILVSVDFLGNPLGLFNDVAEGVSGLLEGNVGGLLKNVTHGVSNSAAKMTGSLSDGMGVVTLDEQHQRQRQRIRYDHSGSSTDHLVAGFQGLGHGLFGAVTGVVMQPIKGASKEGFGGFMTGIGKGMVGIVTKPVMGVLDFASEAASAVRDTSKDSSHQAPARVRKSRCCHGPGGLLPPYSEHHASAQEFLYSLNDDKYQETFLAIEQLRAGKEDSLQVLMSSQQVYFLGRTHSSQDSVMLKVQYDELYQCQSTRDDHKYYIELTMKADNERGVSSQLPRKKPLVRCDSETVAQKVSQQICYAKNLHEEAKQSLALDPLGPLSQLASP